MQNGELDGYRARLVVLQAFGLDFRAVIAEVRARQPQARILIFAPFPRTGSREMWRQVSDTNSKALAPLADNETIFYVDIGERFFLPDGTYDFRMWRIGQAPVGIQTPAFEPWAARSAVARTVVR